MSAKHFVKQLGYELWHQKLGHQSFRNIRDSINGVNGLESLRHLTCDTHDKCPSCMMGKAILEDLPKTKNVISKPLYQIHMHSFSSSVKSNEGCFHSLVFVDAAAGYRWIYRLKTKGKALNVVKRWYANIADLRARNKLVVLMQDNAGEYKSEEVIQYLNSKGVTLKGVKNHFNRPKEQWQNEAAE